MIVLVIVSMAIIFLAIGTAAGYFAHRDDVARAREESVEVQNDRIREEVSVAVNRTTGHLSVDGRWGGQTDIQGIMVRCDDGAVYTSPMGANTSRIMEELRARCS